MTLAEKIGQMTQIEKGSLTPDNVTNYFIGSVLSGGDGYPAQDRTVRGWRLMVDGFQKGALATRLGIPLIYGVDAIHGFGNLEGATLFPQNIGLGATRDPDLVERVARATAEEMLATGARWNFAPVAAVPQDIRWGRTYESFSETPDLVSELGSAYIKGLQDGLQSDTWIKVLGTPKHYVGDGGTVLGSSTQNIMDHPYLLDQGDMRVAEATLRKLFLPPYQAAIQAGAESIMASFSSWNGIKVHASKPLLNDLLKNELGFQGFIVSDWGGVDQIPVAQDIPAERAYYNKIVTAINAGIDMVMVPSDFKTFTATLAQAVSQGDISEKRIDDAVRRILRVKFRLGLFEQPYSDPAALATIGSAKHRALAREAVQKSLVLLKNTTDTGAPVLPIAKDTPTIFLAGQAADDIGIQSEGWTMGWQGSAGNIQPGTTILAGIQKAVSPETNIYYNRYGRFENRLDADGKPLIADVGIVVLGEMPYSEGVGDVADLTLDDNGLIQRVRERTKSLVVILVSGRPLVITQYLPLIDGLVAAWLPGTEGEGVTDVLFGDAPFTGKLPFTWPRWNSQLPFNFSEPPAQGCNSPLFPFGYGLANGDPSPRIAECNKP
jgi:beta-glucosidase